MALLTLTSTLVGWYNLRFISQVEKDNTQALIPTMNMARQLSEASAWELFAAQNLTSADNEKMWQAQGRMLTAQSLKINALLQALREQGFDTTAIEQQEQEISRSLRQQGELVGQPFATAPATTATQSADSRRRRCRSHAWRKVRRIMRQPPPERPRPGFTI